MKAVALPWIFLYSLNAPPTMEACREQLQLPEPDQLMVNECKKEHPELKEEDRPTKAEEAENQANKMFACVMQGCEARGVHTWQAGSSRGPVDKSTDTEVPDEVVELLSIVAEVAVKRAKRNGLIFLQERLESAVCGIQVRSEDSKIVLQTGGSSKNKKLQASGAWAVTTAARQHGSRLLPGTCALLGSTTLDRLASEPKVLATAVLHDLAEVLTAAMIRQLFGPSESKPEGATATPGAATADEGSGEAKKPLEAATTDERSGEAKERRNHALSRLLGLSRTIAARSLLSGDGSVDIGDVKLLMAALRAELVGAQSGWDDKVIAIAVAGFDAWVSHSTLDLYVVINQLCTKQGCTPEERLEAATLASLGYKAATAVNSAGEVDAAARARASIQMLFAIAARITTQDTPDRLPSLKSVESLVLASYDRDIIRAITAATELLEQLIHTADECGGATRPDDQAKKDKKNNKAFAACQRSFTHNFKDLALLLSSVTTYAATYSESAKTQTAQERHASRTVVVESMIDAFTNRQRRHGDWIASLGLPVGFVMGGQSVRTQRQAGVRLATPEAMLPQLTLPMGLAVQRLPGHHHRHRGIKPDGKFFIDGFHAMVTAFDLGQFVAYDRSGDLAQPTWSSFMSLGAQLGWLIGSPSNSFVIAADVRYAPSLIPSASENQPGGVVRFGLFLGYSISLFDLN